MTSHKRKTSGTSFSLDGIEYHTNSTQQIACGATVRSEVGEKTLVGHKRKRDNNPLNRRNIPMDFLKNFWIIAFFSCIEI